MSAPIVQCSYPQHRALGRDWRCAGTDNDGRTWPIICGICHPPAIAAERVEWLPPLVPKRPRREAA